MTNIQTDTNQEISQPAYKFPKWLMWSLLAFGISMIAWQMAVCGGVSEASDTASYLSAWNVLKTFHPDKMRPPVYPLLIGPVFDMFGTKAGLLAMLAIQWCIWIIGCRCTWLTIRHFGASSTIASSVIALIVLFPGTWVMNNLLQTDGPATGLIPLLIWQTILYLNKQRVSYVIYGGMLLMILIFLKPQFLFIIPIWAITWISLTSGNRHHLYLSIAITLAAITSLSIYKWSLYKCYRQNNITIVAPINNYYSLRMAGIIRADEIEDPVANAKLKPYLDADPGTDLPDHYLYWDETWLVSSNQLDSISRNAYIRHYSEANAFILHRLSQSINFSIFYIRGKNRPTDTPSHIAYYEASGRKPKPDPWDFVTGKDLFKVRQAPPGALIYPMYGIMDIPFWVAWVTISVFTVWYLAVWIKRKRFPVVAFYMAAIILGGYATVFIGAPCDWGRLVTPYCMILFSMGGIMVANAMRIYAVRASKFTKLTDKNTSST